MASGKRSFDEALHRLVRLIAAEANPHQLIARVASDAQLLGDVRCVFENQIMTPGDAARLAELCHIHQVVPKFFKDRLRLIVHTLQLVDRERDYYALFGLKPGATRQEIKHAFREASLKLHPDKNPDDPEAAARFRDISQAYEILSNDGLRRHYDRKVHPRWMEELAEDEPEVSRKKGKRRLLYELLALVLLLLLLAHIVDYQDVVTERFYGARNNQHPSPGAMSDGSHENIEVNENGKLPPVPVHSGELTVPRSLPSKKR